MGYRFPKYTLFARLNDQGVPLLCSRTDAHEWSRKNAEFCYLRSDTASGWTIYTQFAYYSTAPDAPEFWQVHWYKYERGVPPRRGSKPLAQKKPRWNFSIHLLKC